MLAKKPKGATEKRKSSGASGLLWMFVGAILTLMIGLALYLFNPIDMGSTGTPEERTIAPINQPESESDDYEFYELLPEQEITSIPDEAIVSIEPSNNGAELEPDVVVTEPRTDNNASKDPDNYGISEDIIRDPMQSQSPQAADGEQEMVIVEEEGTYDEPMNDNPSNAANQNPQGAGNSSRSQAGASSGSIKATTTKQTYILQINSFSSAQEADKRRAQVLMAGVDARVVKTKMANGQVFYQVISSPMNSRQTVISAQQKLQNNGIDSLIVEQRR